MSNDNERARVLLVDPNRDRVAFLGRILQQREFDVAAAESVDEQIPHHEVHLFDGGCLGAAARTS